MSLRVSPHATLERKTGTLKGKRERGNGKGKSKSSRSQGDRRPATKAISLIRAHTAPRSAASLPTLAVAGLIQVKVVTAESGIVCIELARLQRRRRTDKR
jgi:hypothetical protein